MRFYFSGSPPIPTLTKYNPSLLPLLDSKSVLRREISQIFTIVDEVLHGTPFSNATIGYRSGLLQDSDTLERCMNIYKQFIDAGALSTDGISATVHCRHTCETLPITISPSAS